MIEKYCYKNQTYMGYFYTPENNILVIIKNSKQNQLQGRGKSL